MADMSLSDLTNFLQGDMKTGYDTYNPSWQTNMENVYSTQADAYNQHATNIEGLQGLLGSLTNQATTASNNFTDASNQSQQYATNAMNSYNPQTWNDYIASGTVAQPVQDKLQGIYDMQMQNYMTDLNRTTQDTINDMMNRRAYAGVSGSNVTNDLMEQIYNTAASQQRQAANTYGIEQGTNLLAEPYKQQAAALASLAGQTEAAGTSSGIANNLMQALLSNYNTQAGWGKAATDASASGFDLAGQLSTIPTAMREAYTTPLLQMWDALLKAQTSKDIGEMQNSDDDYSWVGGVASLLGGLF